MGKNTFNKISQVSARVRPWVKNIIKTKGYSISDAITYFAELLRRDDPVAMLECKIFFIEEKLEKIRVAKRDLQHEEDDALEDLAALKLELSRYDVSERVFVNEPEVPVDEGMGLAISRIQKVVDEKKDLLYSSTQSKEEFIDVFITLNGDFVRNVFNEYGKGKDWSEFKDDLVACIEV